MRDDISDGPEFLRLGGKRRQDKCKERKDAEQVSGRSVDRGAGPLGCPPVSVRVEGLVDALEEVV